MMIYSLDIMNPDTPRNFFLLHWLVFVCSTVGVIFLLLSRGHYTVDVVLAYVFSTRLW